MSSEAFRPLDVDSAIAAAKCSAILTRDRGIYSKYFPALVGYENCLNL